MGYTEFCEKVLDLFAAFELAATYHHDLHIYAGGRFTDQRAPLAGRGSGW
jgi:hypothetical protein